MSTFDQRPVSRSIPGWLIALGVAWGLASIVGLFVVGRKIIGTVRRQREVQVRGVGPDERALRAEQVGPRGEDRPADRPRPLPDLPLLQRR